MVSYGSPPEKMPQPARKTTRSKLNRMSGKNYSESDWEEGFAAALTATVPAELGGLRFDQALARVFPQYSRNRLQAWLKSGHITLAGKRPPRRRAVCGGGRLVLDLPAGPDAPVPQRHRMPPKIVHED